MERATGSRILLIATVTSVLLALGKFLLGLLSGSLAVMASAADSFSDALMSGVNRWGYRHARELADEEHPYGHGKFEGALAVGQGMLLLGMVVTLIGSSINRLVSGSDPVGINLAMATLAVSGLVSGGLTILLTRAARRERSVVLAADTAHYKVDALAALGAIGGLALAGSTGWLWLDPAVCIAMALLMGRESGQVLRAGVAEILDEALPPEDVAAVREVLERNSERVVTFHGLRTRRSGPLRFVEVHADFEPAMPLRDVHQVVQDIGNQIRAALPGSRVLVHPDAHGLADMVDQALEGKPRHP